MLLAVWLASQKFCRREGPLDAAQPDQHVRRAHTIQDIQAFRARHLPRALSTAYEPSPLKIVRGRAQYLFAEDGRCYTDAVNNVWRLL